MGFSVRRRFVRRSLTSLGIAAAAASALVGAQGSLAFATSTPDVIVVHPNSGGDKGDGAITVTEGDLIEGSVVGHFTDPGFTNAGDNCGTVRMGKFHATIDWGDGSTSDNTTSPRTIVSCHSNPDFVDLQVSGFHRYADSGSYAIKVSVVDTADEPSVSAAAVQTATATVNDAEIFWDFDNRPRGEGEGGGPFVAVEGSDVTVRVFFSDDNSTFFNNGSFDSNITGTIDWGDGSTTQTAPVSVTTTTECNECFGDFVITATHKYDASIPPGAVIPIKVTAKDDGGSSATDTGMSAQISDGSLTAGGTQMLLSPTATKSLTAVLGTFTDAAGAQAKAADFTSVVIHWGDNTVSGGTVSQTASGTFSVSGTHTYGAAGNNSITATVTDEEGNTVTLHATAQVAAAPAAAVVLPATGQPHQPATPALPVAPLALLLGLSAIAGGVTLTRLDRIRH